MSELGRSYELQVTPSGGSRTYSLVPKSTNILTRIAQASVSIFTRREIISGERLVGLLKAGRNTSVVAGGGVLNADLLSSPEFKSFAKSIRKQEIRSICQRALHKASQIGKGLQVMEHGKILSESYWQESLLKGHPYGQDISERGYFEEWKQSSTELHFEAWLTDKLATTQASPLSKVAYLDETQRAAYSVSFREGKIFQGDHPVDTTKMEAGNEAGKGIFVIGPYRKMYVGTHIMGEFHHSSFLSGAAVFGAGSIVTNAEGKIIELSNHSGHYKPGDPQLLATLKLLEDSGVDLSGVKLVRKSANGIDESYNSAKIFLDSQGVCEPDGVGGLEFVRSGGVITALTHPQHQMSKSDVISDLKIVVKKLGLNPDEIKFIRKNAAGDEVEYPSVSEYISNKGVQPSGWSRGDVIRTSDGAISAIIVKRDAAMSEQDILLSDIHFFSHLGQMGIDIGTVMVRQDSDCSGASVKEHLEGSVLRLRALSRGSAE
ncbi:MAG: hypothetical protein NTX49_04615 [Chlamydiae bacterium]|nr:hypothetical protein [Chlamydiota bacterium]